MFEKISVFYNTLNLAIVKEDIKRLCNLSITADNNYSQNFDNLIEMSGYTKIFNDELATAKFEESVQTILQYQILSLTAIESVNKLKIKFPDREFETDLLMVQLLYGFFEGRIGEQDMITYYNRWQWKTIGDQDPTWVEMSKLFMTIYKKYPKEVASLIKNSTDYSSIFWELSRFFYQQDMGPKELLMKTIFSDKLKPNKEAEELKYLFLHTPYKLIDRIDNGFCDELIKNLDTAEISNLATIHSIAVSQIIIDQVYGDIYNRSSPTYLNAKYDESDFLKKIGNGKNKIKLIRAFAEKGDKDAMTVLALRISRGFEKEKRSEALAWIQKAAAIDDNRSYDNIIKYAMVRSQKALEDISSMKF